MALTVRFCFSCGSIFKMPLTNASELTAFLFYRVLLFDSFFDLIIVRHNARPKRKEFTMALESIIVWVIVGGIAGMIAGWLIGGVNTGCIGTVVIGILGAFIGAWLLSALHVSIGTGLVNDIVTASIGASALLLGIRLLRRI